MKAFGLERIGINAHGEMWKHVDQKIYIHVPIGLRPEKKEDLLRILSDSIDEWDEDWNFNEG